MIRKANETIREWANRVNGTRNTNKCHCLFCVNKTLEKGEGYAVVLPECGNRPRYVCEDDWRRLHTKLPYHGNANTRVLEGIGTPKIGDVESTTFGCELEYVAVGEPASVTFKILVERAFNVVEENDCTVTGEFPTDYFRGGNAFSKQIRKLEKFGFMPYLDHNSVGAHIHVECNCMGYVRNWYNTLFVPFSRYLQLHQTSWMVERFGRGFGSYREPISETSSWGSHSNFVNCQHDNTLEFRLPRISSAQQYLNVVYFWREVGCMLNSVEWIAKTENNREIRKNQAVAVSKEILNIAKRYFGE